MRPPTVALVSVLPGTIARMVEDGEPAPCFTLPSVSG